MTPQRAVAPSETGSSPRLTTPRARSRSDPAPPGSPSPSAPGIVVGRPAACWASTSARRPNAYAGVAVSARSAVTTAAAVTASSGLPAATKARHHAAATSSRVAVAPGPSNARRYASSAASAASSIRLAAKRSSARSASAEASCWRAGSPIRRASGRSRSTSVRRVTSPRSVSPDAAQPVGKIAIETEQGRREPLRQRGTEPSRLADPLAHQGVVAVLGRMQEAEGLLRPIGRPSAVRGEPVGVEGQVAGFGVVTQWRIGQSRKGGIGVGVGLRDVSAGQCCACRARQGPDRRRRAQNGPQCVVGELLSQLGQCTHRASGRVRHAQPRLHRSEVNDGRDVAGRVAGGGVRPDRSVRGQQLGRASDRVLGVGGGGRVPVAEQPVLSQLDQNVSQLHRAGRIGSDPTAEALHQGSELFAPLGVGILVLLGLVLLAGSACSGFACSGSACLACARQPSCLPLVDRLDHCRGVEPLWPSVGLSDRRRDPRARRARPAGSGGESPACGRRGASGTRWFSR